MELADVTDSKSVGLITRVGSSPTTGTTNSAQLLLPKLRAFIIPYVLPVRFPGVTPPVLKLSTRK